MLQYRLTVVGGCEDFVMAWSLCKVSKIKAREGNKQAKYSKERNFTVKRKRLLLKIKVHLHQVAIYKFLCWEMGEWKSFGRDFWVCP
jgi:hypothetical protein